MSALAPISPDPATTEAIATAVAHAARRLWLLEMMTRLCTALLAMLKLGANSALVFMKTHGAISRALRLCHKLEAETDRLLRDLSAGILPAPKAGRADAAEERENLEEREDLYDRESRDTQEAKSDKAFRARLEELEALLDGDSAGRSSRETAHTLCRVLGLDPAWLAWLGDDWLADNLTLTPPPTLSSPAPSPPPPPPRGSRPPRQPKPPNPHQARRARRRSRRPPRRR